MIPYLIGLHLTIDGWRKNRNGSGWRLAMRKLRYRAEVVAELGDKEEVADCEAPPVVAGAPRLRSNMLALLNLMSSDTPVLRRVRCKKAWVKGLLWVRGRLGLGVWSDDSDWRGNLVRIWPMIFRSR
jgi:hypothetical protein